MPNVNISLPDTYAVASRGVGVDVALANLSADIIGKLALHGLTQKVGDSAAGAMSAAGFEGRSFKDLTDDERATVQTKAREAMAAVVDQLVKGEWTERRAGGATVDPLVARIRVKFGALLRDQAKDVWKAIKDADDKGEQLDAMFADQPDDLRAAIEKQAKDELAAEAKAKAKLGALKITVNVK